MSYLNVWSLVLTAALAALVQVQGQEPRARTSPRSAQNLFGYAQRTGEASGRYTVSDQNLFGYVQGARESNTANSAYPNLSHSQFLLFSDQADPRTGLGLLPLDEATRTHLKMPKGEGLLVTSVTFHSPAQGAGVVQNDILLSLDDASLSKPEDLETQLKAAGDKPVTLTLLRQGQKKTIKVQPQVSVTFGPVEPETPSYWIGVNVGTLDPALRSHLSVPEGRGLIASEIVPDSPAAKAGLKTNDILLSLAGTPLRDQSALVEAVQKNGEKQASLEIIRDGSRARIEVTPQKRNKTARLTRTWDSWSHSPENFRFQLARPGAVLQFNPTGTGLVPNVANSLQSTPPVGVWAAESPAEKRLDTMDGELKELRKAVEELTRALKDRR